MRVLFRAMFFGAAAWIALKSRLSAEVFNGVPPLVPKVVRHAVIDPDVPIFVPVNPRVATTITFPKPIGEPMGTGFVNSENLEYSPDGKSQHVRGEYLIAYATGDNFFTVQPLPRSEMLNLNVPYEGTTLVLYFYAVDQPLAAVASLIFSENRKGASGGSPNSVSVIRTDETNAAESSQAAPEISERIHKETTLPASSFLTATPARLEGLLKKLRLVHAAKPGDELNDLASALKVSVALSSAEDAKAADLIHPVREMNGGELILLRAVRDPALDAVGFIVLVRNTSDHDLILDPRTFSARCGAAFYTAQIIDSPARLAPHELKAAYFVIVGSGDGRPGYLAASNDWLVSVSNFESGKTAAQKNDPDAAVDHASS